MGLMTLCCWGTGFLTGCSIRLNPGGTEEPFCGLDIVVFCRLCEMLLSDGLDGSSLTQDAGGTGAELGSGAMARPANFCPAGG